MKKLTFLISLLMIAAFVLAACGSADQSEQTPGANLTPGAMNPTAAVGSGLETPAATNPVVETPAATMPAVETPAATMPAAETPLAQTPAAGTTGTPQAGANVPVTGNYECNPTVLQNLLGMNVYDNQGNKIAEISSAIALRDMNAVTASENDKGDADNNGAQATTPVAGATPQATTPAAGNNAGNGAALTIANMVAPQLQYMVLDLEGGNTKEVLLPFGALDLSSFAKNANTNAAGNANGAVAANDCGVTLNSNITVDDLNNAPDFSYDNVDLTADNWDNNFRTFWTDKGLSNIPVTGQNNLGAPVILKDTFTAINAKNANGDDLGEVDDFILDPQTGEFKYAVLAAGGFLGIGEKYIPVPVSNVQWVSEDNEADDEGYVIINTTKEEFQNAPSYNAANEINNTVEGWDQDIQNFWNNLGGNTTQ